MKRICNLLLILGCFTATSALADTRARAITITTDAFAGNFAIDTTRGNDGALTAIIYIGPNSPNGNTMSIATLSRGPQLLYSSQGHDAIFLGLESDFNVQKGGHAYVRFLNNGIDGSYKNFRVLVDVENTVILRSDPNPNDPDSDNNSYTGVFNHAFLQKNTFFGQTIGIDQIIPSLE